MAEQVLPQNNQRLDENGHELLDQTPVTVPAGFRRPETLAEQVQRLVRNHISRQAEAEGYESFEESEDFDVDEPEEPSTIYEEFFDPTLGRSLTAQEFKQHELIYRKKFLEAQAAYYAQVDRFQAWERKRGAGGGQPPASTKEPPSGEKGDSEGSP